MDVLGCPWMQFDNPDDDPDWVTLRATLRDMKAVVDPETVYAPLPEDGGHHHHNRVGEIALEVFDLDTLVFYATYTHARGRSEIGHRHSGDLSEEQQKRNALSKYRTQISDPRTAMHFSRPSLDEFYSPAPARSSPQAS
jgi:LmbE family N-acetylglucosaminyl deacetylase